MRLWFAGNSVLVEQDNFRGFDPHQTENRDVSQNIQDAEKC